MAEPEGCPNAAALICGTPGCTEPALIWLSGLEATEYRKGQRLVPDLGRQFQGARKVPAIISPIAIRHGQGGDWIGRGAA